MDKEKIPFLVENKERDTFTFYVKGTKPYLDLEKKLDQLTNNWNELEKWVIKESEKTMLAVGHMTALCMVLDKMKEIKGRKDVSNNN